MNFSDYATRREQRISVQSRLWNKYKDILTKAATEEEKTALAREPDEIPVASHTFDDGVTLSVYIVNNKLDPFAEKKLTYPDGRSERSAELDFRVRDGEKWSPNNGYFEFSMNGYTLRVDQTSSLNWLVTATSYNDDFPDEGGRADLNVYDGPIEDMPDPTPENVGALLAERLLDRGDMTFTAAFLNGVQRFVFKEYVADLTGKWTRRFSVNDEAFAAVCAKAALDAVEKTTNWRDMRTRVNNVFEQFGLPTPPAGEGEV